MFDEMRHKGTELISMPSLITIYDTLHSILPINSSLPLLIPYSSSSYSLLFFFLSILVASASPASYLKIYIKNILLFNILIIFNFVLLLLSNIVIQSVVSLFMFFFVFTVRLCLLLLIFYEP